MGFRDQYNFDEYLVNESENLVIMELERQLSKDQYKNVCQCQDCILDMAALALNSVKPFYRVSLLGKLYAEALDEDNNYIKAVRDAVQKAIGKIAENPSH